MPAFTPASTPATILFFDHTAKMGGGEIALLNLVTHLDRARFEPVVVVSEEGPLCLKLRAAGIEIHVLPLSPEVTGVRKDSLSGARAVSLQQLRETLHYIWQIRRFARARGAAVLHTNSLKADLIGALAGRLAGIPVIWHVRDRIADDYLPSLATRAFRALCAFLPHYLVVNSAATLESLQLPARARARAEANGVIHDGLPPLEKAPSLAPEAPLSEVPLSPAGVPKIGLVGRISPWKGQDVFLGAAALVVEKHPEAHFQIIGAPLFGEEDYEAELHRLCAQLKLEKQVQWLGFRSDVMELVSQLTLLVHASTTGEPFGQVVVEAMMAARPVVATRGGGIPEIVVEGETGLLVPMGDARAMAQAIEHLLDDPALSRAMGEAGERRAAAHFTIHHTVAKVSRLYEDVLRDQIEKRRQRWIVLACLILAATTMLRLRAEKRGGRR